jgi:2,4-dienoyl-CoA reductase-like NADH-dependent reductase (Old Yellow Enzyme family)
VQQGTDDSGGSIEYCAQLVLEVVDVVVAAVGAEKTVIRFSPWNHCQGKAQSILVYHEQLS